MNIKPTGSRVLVERLVATEIKTEGGIYLTPGLTYSADVPNGIQHIKEVDQASEPDAHQAKVISVGPDTKGVKEGDVVLVGKYAGVDLFKDRVSYIINEHDVLAIVG